MKSKKLSWTGDIDTAKRPQGSRAVKKGPHILICGEGTPMTALGSFAERQLLVRNPLEAADLVSGACRITGND